MGTISKFYIPATIGVLNSNKNDTGIKDHHFC